MSTYLFFECSWVRRKIDSGEIKLSVVSSRFIAWIHKEFCERLPEEMLWVENPDASKKTKVIPGEFRKSFVQVGRHIPPSAENFPDLMKRFEEFYEPKNLSRVEQIMVVAVSHHRLLWIHPFYYGNGRVARLFSHAYIKKIDLGCQGLWSVSRGLARNVEEYKSKLMEADHPRRSDQDGRGNLSAEGLRDFCEFFLTVCVDQVDFMNKLLEPMELKNRIEVFARENISARRLPKGSDTVLAYVLLFGEMPAGK